MLNSGKLAKTGDNASFCADSLIIESHSIEDILLQFT
jgi:hypothetical protein